MILNATEILIFDGQMLIDRIRIDKHLVHQVSAGIPGVFLSCCKPVDKPIDHTGGGAVDDDRTGDGEHFSTHTGNEALGFELYRCGRDGVGKSGNGNQGSGSGVFGNVIVDTKPSEQSGQGHQSHGSGGGRVNFFKSQLCVSGNQQLAQGADEAANQKGTQAILIQMGLGTHLLYQLIVFFFRHNNPSAGYCARKYGKVAKKFPG